MKLLYSSASPYSAKVRMAAAVTGVAIESKPVSTADEPADLIDNNPLGKIPTLITDEGLTVFDSRAIMGFLDRTGSQRIYPRNAEKRTETDVLEALCDGICDALLLCVYEKRYRTEETFHQPWVDLQWRKVLRGLDSLETRIPRMGKSPSAVHLAIAALVGYLALRFDGKWERGHPKLKAFAKKFSANYPGVAELMPSA
ncbi:MAG: glutathione S-transferase [Rhizobiales bacterium]|nr:glutathione S-transferase [Hyphomicrobiales bacterium]MBA70054.1 glutathione S-transferase [Hyphomicrobiales bacterium]|tara:strand:+ start:2604 stop:3200 length:597 start_codon:yes stop_codon:yes gene_type:complete